MDPLVTSSLISAGTSMLGGLFGGGQKRPRSQDAVKYLLGSKYIPGTKQLMSYSQALGVHDANMMKARMKGAEEAGIHPMYAIGAASAGSPVNIDVGAGGSDGGKGAAMADMGQGISRAVAAYGTREQRELETISARLQVENQALQNERLRSENHLMKAAGSPPGLGDDARYPQQSRMPLGYGDTAPFLRVGKDPKGNLIRVYNDDLGDNELLQAITALGYSVPDWLHGNIGKPAAKQLRAIARSAKRGFAGKPLWHYLRKGGK